MATTEEDIEIYKKQIKKMKIIEQYPVSKQLNILREALIQLSDDKELSKMGKYINNILNEDI